MESSISTRFHHHHHLQFPLQEGLSGLDMGLQEEEKTVNGARVCASIGVSLQSAAGGRAGTETALPCAMQKPAAPEQELWKLPPSLPALGPPAVQTQICFAVLSR